MSSSKKAFSGVTNKARFENPQQQNHVDSLAKNIAILTGQTTNKNDRAILFRDLLQYGLVDRNGKLNPGVFANDTPYKFEEGNYPWNPRPVMPHAPQNVTATPAFTTVMIRWDTPTYAGHNHAEIWRNTVDSLGNMDETQSGGEAVLVATASGALYVDNVNYNTQYYYWVRFINANGQPGPVHDASGVPAHTFRSVQDQIDELAAENEAALEAYQQQFNQMVADVDARADDLYDRLSKLDDTYVTDAYANQYIYTKVETESVISGEIDAFQSAYVDPEFNSIASALGNRYTKSEANSATAGQIDTFRANLLDENGSFASAFINRVNEVITDDNAAVATQIASYEVSYGGNTYSLAEVTQISVSVNGEYSAQWGIQSSTNNLQHGIGFYNDNGTTRFMVNANNFAVFNPADGEWKQAFAVSNGEVFMSTALIGEAFVGSLAVELNAVFEGEVLVNTRLTAAQIYGAKIKGDALWLERNGWTVSFDPSSAFMAWFGSTTYFNPDADVDNRTVNNAKLAFLSNGVLQARGLKIINDNNNVIMEASGLLDGAYIKNLSVDTLQIKGNAVTVPTYVETSAITTTGSVQVYDGYFDLNTGINPTSMAAFSLHVTRNGDTSQAADKITVTCRIYNIYSFLVTESIFEDVSVDADGSAGTIRSVVPLNFAGQTSDVFRIVVNVDPEVTSQSYTYKMIGFVQSVKR